MILIVGLGNPGKRYAKTRHNLGWLVLEALASHDATRNPQPATRYQSKFKIKKRLKSAICETKIGSQQFILAKPLTYMNNSGEAVKKLIGNWKLEIGNLIVVHDDLDLPLGSFKIQFAKGPKEHKGVKSVERALGTKDFWRVRGGIENRMSKVKCQKSKVFGEEYVLGKFTREEMEILEKTISLIIEALLEKINMMWQP